MLTIMPVDNVPGSKRKRWIFNASTPARWAGETFSQSRVDGPITPSAPSPARPELLHCGDQLAIVSGGLIAQRNGGFSLPAPTG